VFEKHPNYSVYVNSFPIKSCSAKVGLCSTFMEGKTGTPTVLSEQTYCKACWVIETTAA